MLMPGATSPNASGIGRMATPVGASTGGVMASAAVRTRTPVASSDLDGDAAAESAEPAQQPAAIEIVETTEGEGTQRDAGLHEQRPPVRGSGVEQHAGLRVRLVDAGERDQADGRQRERREAWDEGPHRRRRPVDQQVGTHREREQAHDAADPDRGAGHVDGRGEDRDGGRKRGGMARRHEQDDSRQAGRRRSDPSPSAGQDEQRGGASGCHCGARQLEESVAARRTGGRRSTRLQSIDGSPHHRCGGRDEEEPGDRASQRPRHRSSPDHDAVEDRNPQRQQGPEVGQASGRSRPADRYRSEPCRPVHPPGCPPRRRHRSRRSPARDGRPPPRRSATSRGRCHHRPVARRSRPVRTGRRGRSRRRASGARSPLRSAMSAELTPASSGSLKTSRISSGTSGTVAPEPGELATSWA